VKEKTTKLAIVNNSLKKKDLMNHMGCEPIQTDYYRVSFDDSVVGNRCSPKIIDRLIATIKPDDLDKWKFKAGGGGLLYGVALRAKAKELGFSEIRIKGKKRPTDIYVTSKVEAYLDHDKRVMLWAQRLSRKGVIVYPVACSETDDTCEVPTKRVFLKSLGVHDIKKLETEKE